MRANFVSRMLPFAAVIAFALPVAAPPAAGQAEPDGGSCTVHATTGSNYCSFYCHGNDKVSVSASGIFVTATASCGGASTVCSGTLSCSSTSASKAASYSWGVCTIAGYLASATCGAG